MDYRNKDTHKFNRMKSAGFNTGDFVLPYTDAWAAPAHMQHLLPSEIRFVMGYYAHAFSLWDSNMIHAHPYQGGRFILMGVN